MKKYILLLALFFIPAIFCKCTALNTNKWNDFSGYLDRKEVKLSLFIFANGTVNGNYCYKKDEKKINLTGTIKNNQIELTEYLNGKANGFFSGEIYSDNMDRFEGEWTSNDQSSILEFKLVLQAACSGTLEKRYSDFSGTDDDVENFMKHVKASIVSDDKEWIADHASYPIKTSLNGKRITIKNKKQLISDFDKIFPPKFKDQLQAYCCCNLFNNYQGAMLGNGEIWINDRPGPDGNKPGYSITTINN